MEKSVKVIIYNIMYRVLYLGSLHTDVADSKWCGKDKGGGQEKAK